MLSAAIAAQYHLPRNPIYVGQALVTSPLQPAVIWCPFLLGTNMHLPHGWNRPHRDPLGYVVYAGEPNVARPY